MAVNPSATPSVTPAGSSPARGWATASVWAGALWMVFAVLPIPGTTLLGLPLSLFALIAGFVSARVGGQDRDRVAVRRGRWGIGLGCAGYVYLLVFFTILGGIGVAALIAAIRAAGTPTP